MPNLDKVMCPFCSKAFEKDRIAEASASTAYHHVCDTQGGSFTRYKNYSTGIWLVENFLSPTEVSKEEEPLTDKLPYDLTQTPFEALRRLGYIFREGDRYGRQNWRKGVGSKKYQIERANHALKHLLVYIHKLETSEYLGQVKGETPEDDLAKVLWFCATQCELERLEGHE